MVGLSVTSRTSWDIWQSLLHYLQKAELNEMVCEIMTNLSLVAADVY